MTGTLFRKISSRVPPSSMKHFFNLYMPYRGAGIRVTEIAKDFTSASVEMKMTWYNRNYVGTHFGGSLYAMVDPFYMFLIMNRLGRDYIVWDKSASVRFLKPGRGKVQAKLEISEDEYSQIIEHLSSNEKMDFTKTAQVQDESGQVIAEISKVIYIKNKKHRL